MWLYRWLLRLYPAGFRAEYGAQMEAVFGEKRRAASGTVSVLAVWFEAVLDVIRHALPLHLDALRQDLRYTFRSLARSPGFTVTVILVSGLGIGANTAVFTVTDWVLIRPLPFQEPDRLVKVWQRLPEYSEMEPSPANYRDWRNMSTSFDAMAAYAGVSANLAGSDEPVRVRGSQVTADLLPMLGVRLALGRAFAADDDRDGAPGTVILSHGLWQRTLGGDPGVIGQTLLLDDMPYTVIGVMPRDFQFPNQSIEYWTPFRFGPDAFEDRTNNYLEVLARLGPGVSLDQARAEMESVTAALEEAYPVANERTGATVNRLRDEVPSQARMLLLALMAASVCVLLIACVNLANLLLARAMVRRHELAVRSSLGAGRHRLIRQLLTESTTLATLGGGLGVMLAYVGMPLLARLVPERLPMGGAPTIDARVLFVALGVTALTGFGFGALPAIRAARGASATSLRDGARGGGGRRERVRAALVIVEVTASVALLIAAGLLMRAFAEVRSIDPGFRAENVLTLRTWLSWPKYAPVAERTAFYSRVLDEVRRLPGVSSAGYTSYLPIVMGGGIWPVEMDGRPRNRADETASLRFVTPDYFAALGIPILRGRDVTTSDTQDRAYVAVVSQSFADRYWPGQDPIGRSFGFGIAVDAATDSVQSAIRTVVGVVGDVKVRGLERTSEPQVYLPHQQTPDGSLIGYTPKDLAVRVSGDAMRLAPAIREIIRRADATQPISSVQLLEDIVTENTAPRRVQLRVLGAFAALAILLAAIGVHGLLSFTVTHRAKEIGVRIALGADRRGILAMVLREGLVLGAAGVVLGAFLGFAAGRAMQALLAGVPPADAITFGTAIMVSVAVILLGSLFPALRAAAVDPNVVIRES
ncbi:MAG: ABC transporter permease [Longimicrobiales bacterium]